MPQRGALQRRAHGAGGWAAQTALECRADLRVLKKTGELSISVETIYRRIRWDKKVGGSLWRHTRIMSKFGRKRYGRRDSRGVLPGKRHISERPVEVEERKRL